MNYLRSSASPRQGFVLFILCALCACHEKAAPAAPAKQVNLLLDGTPRMIVFDDELHIAILEPKGGQVNAETNASHVKVKVTGEGDVTEERVEKALMRWLSGYVRINIRGKGMVMSAEEVAIQEVHYSTEKYSGKCKYRLRMLKDPSPHVLMELEVTEASKPR